MGDTRFKRRGRTKAVTFCRGIFPFRTRIPLMYVHFDEDSLTLVRPELIEWYGTDEMPVNAYLKKEISSQDLQLEPAIYLSKYFLLECLDKYQKNFRCLSTVHCSNEGTLGKTKAPFIFIENCDENRCDIALGRDLFKTDYYYFCLYVSARTGTRVADCLAFFNKKLYVILRLYEIKNPDLINPAIKTVLDMSVIEKLGQTPSFNSIVDLVDASAFNA